MSKLLRPLGWLALLVTLLAPVLYAAGEIGDLGLRNMLGVSMIAWFAVAVVRDQLREN